jgi:PAS domain S-box-containing protein
MSDTPYGQDSESLQAEIAALRQQVAALSERELFFREFVESIDDCVLQVSPQGTILYINQAVERLLGYTVDEVIGTSILHCLHPDEHEISQQIIAGWVENHLQSDRYENRMVSKSGEILHILWSASMHYDNDGNLLSLKAIGCDITDRKRLEDEVQRANDELEERIAQQTQALEHQQALLLGVVDNLPASLTVRDMDGLFLLVNRHYTKLSGVDRATMLGKYDKDIFPPEMVAAWRVSDQQLREVGTPIELEENYDLPDGTHTFISAKFPIYDNDGTIYAIGVITTDITDRKQAEDELRNFKALADYAPDIIAVSSLEGIITYVNPAHSHEFGTDGEAIGKPITFFYAPETQQRLPEILHTIQTAGIWQGELLNQRYDGSTFLALSSGFLIRDADGNPQAMGAIVRNITDLRKSQQQQVELQQRIIDTQKNALRELSTPLIPIANNVILMPLVGSIDSKRAQDIIEMLLEGVAHHQADIAIVDITGVPIIDTQVANTIIQAAKAVNLLGSQIVLTGIGPTMAQTLVHLGSDLSTIITRGSLQNAVRWVLSER